jgi:hypothetical protein
MVSKLNTINFVVKFGILAWYVRPTVLGLMLQVVFCSRAALLSCGTFCPEWAASFALCSVSIAICCFEACDRYLVEASVRLKL